MRHFRDYAFVVDNCRSTCWLYHSGEHVLKEACKFVYVVIFKKLTIVVDFPAPLCPSNTVTECFSNETDRLSTAVNAEDPPPYTFVNPLTQIPALPSVCLPPETKECLMLNGSMYLAQYPQQQLLYRLLLYHPAGRT